LLLEAIPAARHISPLRRALNIAREQGVPQHLVAREARIATGHLSAIANGDFRPTPEMAQRIAAALGCTMRELFPDL
jgi:transcriptional regulator with XRE-family HTH domain